MTPPKLIDIIGLPGPAATVEVCGYEFVLGEWPIKYHAMWNHLVEERGLDRAMAHLRYATLAEVAMAEKNVQADPRVQDLTERINTLNRMRDVIYKRYGTKKEPKDADERLDEITKRLQPLHEQLAGVGDELEAALLDKQLAAEHEVRDFRDLQDDVRLEFAHAMAKANPELDVQETLEEWRAKATTADFEALQRWIDGGNAPWAARVARTLEKGMQTPDAGGTPSRSKSSRRESRSTN